LGKAGDFGNVADRDAALAHHAGGAAGRDNFGAELVQRAGEIDDSSFIGDTDQNTHHSDDNTTSALRRALAAAEFQRDGLAVPPVLVDLREELGGLGELARHLSD